MTLSDLNFEVPTNFRVYCQMSLEKKELEF